MTTSRMTISATSFFKRLSLPTRPVVRLAEQRCASGSLYGVSRRTRSPARVTLLPVRAQDFADQDVVLRLADLLEEVHFLIERHAGATSEVARDLDVRDPRHEARRIAVVRGTQRHTLTLEKRSEHEPRRIARDGIAIPRCRDHRNGIAVPPHDEARTCARRLRDVPGQSERG